MSELYLSEFFNQRYRPLKLRGKSDNTVRLYRVDMRHFQRFLNRPPMVSDLTSLCISGFLDWMARSPSRSGGKRSPYTVEKARTQLMALARYAAKVRLIGEEPEVEPGRLPLRVPRAYTEIEMGRLVDSCRAETGFVAYVDADKYWLSMVLVLFDTGERIGAIRFAEWAWIDLDGGWLSVPAEFRKGGGADRVYRLASDTLEVLRLIYDGERRLIWPWVRSTTHLYYHYQRILKRAGLYIKRHMFHAIRRTTASHYEAAGGNATELLDHSKRSLTKKSYLDPRIVGKNHAADLLFRPRGANPPAC